MTFLGYEWYNDISLLPTYLLGAVAYLLLLFCAIFFHEWGHIIYFRRNNIESKFKFRFNSIWDWGGDMEIEGDISDDDYLNAIWFGICFGLIPLVVSSFLFFPSSLMVIPYIVVCLPDLKEANKIYKKRGQGFLNLEDDDDGNST